MPNISVVGAKGGCGASLVATNLALGLTRHGTTLLVDLHNGDGTDDLLLDLRPERSWADLLAVAEELAPRQLDLAALSHPGGLRLLAAPSRAIPAEATPLVSPLLHVLAARCDWLVVDLPPSSSETQLADVLVVVATPDPPALRNAQRLLQRLAPEIRPRARLVLNQFTRAHPGDPHSIASALECPLLGVLPSDSRGVGFQISFGRPCLLDAQSAFGRGAAAMARALAGKRIAGRAAA
jgi:pilus assembly protein CpaE